MTEPDDENRLLLNETVFLFMAKSTLVQEILWAAEETILLIRR